MFESIEFILNKGLVECIIINYFLEGKKKNREGEKKSEANALEKQKDKCLESEEKTESF